MDGMDGLLQVPPDRSQILGRQAWKTRYVVVGPRPAAGRDRQGSYGFTNNGNIARVSTVVPRSPPAKAATNDVCLSIYKIKDDWEPIQQWSLGNVSDCQVQLVSYRKQGPVLPTLVITILDTQRKRRSSRATGFMSTNKESGATVLWFRLPPEADQPSLHDWAQYIQTSKGTWSATDSPVSPVFTSPFQIRSNDVHDSYTRPGSGSRGLQHKSSTATYSTGPLERPGTFSSESPSLRSKRSDISSPSSNNYPIQSMPPPISEHQYASAVAEESDTLGALGSSVEYSGEFIEGWTSAQGRSSAMSASTAGRRSVSSHAHKPSMVDVKSPPGPGETILDRAFQLGHIPGAGAYVPGQEKLSSIARFDALMREAEEKRCQGRATSLAEQAAMRSAFDDDDDEDDDESLDEDVHQETNRDSSDSDSGAHSDTSERDSRIPLMSHSAQRALAYIAGHPETNRHSKSHRPGLARTHASYHADLTTMMPASRPRTAYAKSRPNAARTQSTPYLAPAASSTTDALSIPKAQEEGRYRSPRASTITEKRRSGSSIKRASFTEFTKRLSSTSSLLVVQTNVSGGSSHVGSETDLQSASAARHRSMVRGSNGSSRTKDRDEQDRKCGWRGSVGVVGTDGGFL